MRFHAAAPAFEPDELVFELSRGAVADPVVHFLETIPVVRRNQVKNAFANHLLRRMRLDHPQTGWIHLEEGSIRSQNFHTLRAMLHESPQELLTGAGVRCTSFLTELGFLAA